MTESIESPGVGSTGNRRPYVKPIVRNLDLMDTNGKPHPNIAETTIVNTYANTPFGPS